jgi:RHS repeat-associated protein
MTASEVRHLADELGAEIADNAPAPTMAGPTTSTTPTTSGDEVSFRFGDRRWRVQGLPPKPLPGALRVNVLVSRDGGAFHVDTLELYSARQRAHFTKLASDELGVEENAVKRDLGNVLLKLEEFLEKRQKESDQANKPRELTEGEQNEALGLLRDPQLLDRILEDFERAGVVGEATNKLVGYLAATSRKLEQPLAVVIQSSSAAGKSSLMDAVLELMPEEERVQYSTMTGQSLFYMGEANLSHKILAIVEEQGAERASYALKLLQSEGELTIASTGKDPATGRLITQEYHVEGPVMIFQTTTAVDMDEELLNRCIVLTVDEGREQTRAIHERQRRARTLEGMIARQERQRILGLHQNAQRLIRPLFVVNPRYEDSSRPHRVTSRLGVTYAYDANGAMTSRTGGGIPGGSQTFHLNQDLELPWKIASSALGDTYLEYDADGARVAKRGANRTSVYAGDLYECEGPTMAGGVPFSCAEQRYKVYAGSRLVAQVTRKQAAEAETTRYVHADILGSSSYITNEEGDVVETRRFDAFGSTLDDFSSSSVRAGFTGHEADDDLGLVNMKGRLYDAQLRRFTSADPLVASPLNTQGINRYSYVQNNPLTIGLCHKAGPDNSRCEVC